MCCVCACDVCVLRAVCAKPKQERRVNKENKALDPVRFLFRPLHPPPPPLLAMNNPPYADDVDEEYTDDTDFEGEEEFEGEEGAYGDGSDGLDADADDDDGLVEEGALLCLWREM